MYNTKLILGLGVVGSLICFGMEAGILAFLCGGYRIAQLTAQFFILPFIALYLFHLILMTIRDRSLRVRQRLSRPQAVEAVHYQQEQHRSEEHFEAT